jgi:8-hydroxy-5-deazaflavin:NADPH oxidoreductase
MNIAFIGVGNVGAPLADHLQKLGHQVSIAARNAESQKVQDALKLNAALAVLEPSVAVEAADIVFLATPFDAVDAALTPLKSSLSGKILVDCTNPVGANLTHALNSQQSASELIQSMIPEAHVVKAFTIYGFENFENNDYPGYGDLKPAMLIAGNNAEAKSSVLEICQQLGWEPVDTGKLSASLHLEHMALLWIEMARVQGCGPNFVWGRLTR